MSVYSFNKRVAELAEQTATRKSDKNPESRVVDFSKQMFTYAAMYHSTMMNFYLGRLMKLTK